MRADAPTRLLVCERNEGAADVGEELRRTALAAGDGRVPFVLVIAATAEA